MRYLTLAREIKMRQKIKLVRFVHYCNLLLLYVYQVSKRQIFGSLFVVSYSSDP